MNERIDAAIDRLDAALGSRGLELAPAPDPDVVHSVDAQLAPYSLPADLRRFWERVDLAELPVRGSYLHYASDAAIALETHRLNQDEFPDAFGPPLLFPIARHHAYQCSVELADSSYPGGVVVSYDIEAHNLLYPSFTDLVEVYAELVAEGRFERQGSGTGWVDLDAERRLRDERWRASDLAEVFGGKRELDIYARDWPAHWRASAGIEDGYDVPLGTTHTLAELVAASSGAPLQARIAGRIASVGVATGDAYYVIDDGTAAIDVLCPEAVGKWLWPGVRELEFGVTVERPIEPLTGAQADGSETVVGKLFEAIPRTSVVATDVRPVA